ncbi:MAG: fused MFS/spermidine synthase [Chloroflexota bacterium]
MSSRSLFTRIPPIWPASLLVFISGACIMIVELAAARILAPYIGVSLFTWTSVIGVVMAGISLGSFIGGRIADRYPSTATLAILLFASGLATLSILPTTAFMGGFPFPEIINVIDRIVLHVVAIFFLPTLVMGMITPTVIKLVLKDLGKTGGTVGTVYAANCVGSILGTFATGFILISWLGTRPVIWMVALTLALLGAAFGEPWKGKARAGTTLLVLAIFVLAFNWRGEWRAPALKESNYYSISITNKSVENRAVKALTLDYLIHSYVEVGNPLFLGYGYHKIFAEVTHYVRQSDSSLRALFIGGGGYNFPRYMEVVYPHSELEVIEIDPAVTEVAHNELGMPRKTRIKTYNMDARIFFIDNNINSKHDLVFGDAFNDLSIPYHLTTYEFNEKIKRSLKSGGLYVVNLVDDYEQGNFLRSYIHTLRYTFRHVYLLQDRPSGERKERSTFVVVASNVPIDREAFNKAAAEKGSVYTIIMEDDELERYLKEKTPVTLTDDYAPVDNMIAPIFAQRSL